MARICCRILLSVWLMPLGASAAAPLFELRAELAGGTVHGALFAAGDGAAARLRLELRARGVRLGELPALQDVLAGAPADMDIELTGPGATVEAFLAGADGRVSIAAGDGRILSSDVGFAESDLLVQTFQAITLDSGPKAAPRMRCGAVQGAVRNGVLSLDRSLALETDKLYVLGSGTVRLADRRLDVSMRPTVREGLGLGAAGLAKAVRIQGTIAEPTFAVDAGGAAETGVQIGAAVATGGLSILAQKLFNDAVDDPHPCFTLAGRTPPDDGRAAGNRGLLESAGDRVGDTVDSAADGVGNIFRGIRNAFD